MELFVTQQLGSGKPSLDHAAARVYQRPEPQVSPGTIGNTFKPGEWAPSKQDAKTGAEAQESKKGAEAKKDFEPEEWKP